MHKAPPGLKRMAHYLMMPDTPLQKRMMVVKLQVAPTLTTWVTKTFYLQRNGLNGLLFFKVYEEGVCIGAAKVLILNK